MYAHTIKKMGIDATFVDPECTTEELNAAFKENTKAVFGETIANPALVVLDLEKFAAAAHAHGVPFIVDNTFATPVNCRPFEMCIRDRIRSMLEGMCARWATEHITPEQIEQLEEIVLLSEFHLKKDKDKVVQVSDLDGKFHHVLYEASNSRIMEHTLSDFHKYVKMARMLSVGAKNRAEKSIEEHKAILEAIKKGDADEAERLANLHIMHVMENLHIEIED